MVPDYQQQPPTKANLKAWWHSFTFAQKVKKESENKDETTHLVFGKPLKESLKYASVQISTANANGELYVWGYIPVVVAKCGLYLKEKATEVEGTFRVNGSSKRMRELQAAFETPPRFGKELDWKKETYTTHDVASVFRRYLTQMPEPVIPHDLYHDFRDALAKTPSNQEDVIATYKRLIRRMPRANQYLLLYVLDLLSVFARKSDKNLMTATNLAVIFRPGLISHPNHEMSPPEHALSQKVLEFLIAQQDWFMLDIPPPPKSAPGSGLGEPTSPTEDDADDITVFPSSDEEGQSSLDGWKLVGTQRRRPTRRRTTLEQNEGELPPVSETVPTPEDSLSIGSGSATVSRSRTLPSGRSPGQEESGAGGANAPHTAEQQRRVLRKQKRASSSQPAANRSHSSEIPPLAT